MDLSVVGTQHYRIEHQKWSTCIAANLLLQKQTYGYVQNLCGIHKTDMHSQLKKQPAT